MNINKILGQNIKKAREARNFSQEKFAEMIGIGVPTLSKIECGKSYPKKETLEKIIKVLNIEPYMLYINTEQEIDVDDMYNSILEHLNIIKQNKALLKSVYDYTNNLKNIL